jgi:thiopeptide-type bacteriocin biosynthesis protein
MDDLLDDLGLDDSAKRECLTRIVAGNRRMLKTGVASERSIGAKYRAERKPLEELFSRELPEDHVLAPGLQALARRSKALERITARLHELVARGGLTDGVPALCPSYLHMEANRLLRGAARQHELVLYDFLLRHYEARVARLKGKTAS